MSWRSLRRGLGLQAVKPQMPEPEPLQPPASHREQKRASDFLTLFSTKPCLQKIQPPKPDTETTPEPFLFVFTQRCRYRSAVVLYKCLSRAGYRTNVSATYQRQVQQPGHGCMFVSRLGGKTHMAFTHAYRRGCGRGRDYTNILQPLQLGSLLKH